MAQDNDDKAKVAEQTDLFGKLEKADVKVADDAAETMKENILKDRGGNYITGLGDHDVKIVSVELVEAKTGTIGMKAIVEDEDGAKSDVTYWLSEAALPYSIENMSRIVVRNAPEAKKADARNFMSNIMSAMEFFKAVQEFLAQAEKKKKPFEAILHINVDANGRTYTDKNGEEKPSLVRSLRTWYTNIKPDTTETAQATMGGGEKIDLEKSNIPF